MSGGQIIARKASRFVRITACTRPDLKSTERCDLGEICKNPCIYLDKIGFLRVETLHHCCQQQVVETQVLSYWFTITKHYSKLSDNYSLMKIFLFTSFCARCGFYLRADNPFFSNVWDYESSDGVPSATSVNIRGRPSQKRIRPKHYCRYFRDLLW